MSNHQGVGTNVFGFSFFSYVEYLIMKYIDTKNLNLVKWMVEELSTVLLSSVQTRITMQVW